MNARIEVVPMSAVRVGDWICHVDDDALTTETVNASYDADEQDWYRVTSIVGMDAVTVRLAAPDGGEASRSGECWQTTWRLVEDVEASR